MISAGVLIYGMHKTIGPYLVDNIINWFGTSRGTNVYYVGVFITYIVIDAMLGGVKRLNPNRLFNPYEYTG